LFNVQSDIHNPVQLIQSFAEKYILLLKVFKIQGVDDHDVLILLSICVPTEVQSDTHSSEPFSQSSAEKYNLLLNSVSLHI
jgi:hypothetical protein